MLPSTLVNSLKLTNRIHPERIKLLILTRNKQSSPRKQNKTTPEPVKAGFFALDLQESNPIPPRYYRNASPFAQILQGNTKTLPKSPTFLKKTMQSSSLEAVKGWVVLQLEFSRERTQTTSKSMREGSFLSPPHPPNECIYTHAQK